LHFIDDSDEFYYPFLFGYACFTVCVACMS